MIAEAHASFGICAALCRLACYFITAPTSVIGHLLVSLCAHNVKEPDRVQAKSAINVLGLQRVVAAWGAQELTGIAARSGLGHRRLIPLNSHAQWRRLPRVTIHVRHVKTTYRSLLRT